VQVQQKLSTTYFEKANAFTRCFVILHNAGFATLFSPFVAKHRLSALWPFVVLVRRRRRPGIVRKGRKAKKSCFQRRFFAAEKPPENRAKTVNFTRISRKC